MTVPAITRVYPADNDVGIPIGISIEVDFDVCIDLSTAKEHTVLYGRDSDMTSGPHQALWIDRDTGDNPFFLSSPGFKGVVPMTASVIYYDLDTGIEVDPGVITGTTDEEDYGVAGLGHRLLLTPTEQLAADVTYTLHILGDPDTVGTGISKRTVYDVEPDGGNSGTTGEVIAYGGYTRSVDDTVIIQITKAGNIGTAEYKWYYNSDGPGTAILGCVTHRRFRMLKHGLQVQFTGSAFEVGDIYSFNVEHIERLATNTKVVFTTNDGSYTAAPASPSTPATSSPPSTVIPPAPGAPGVVSPSTVLEVTDMVPAHASYNNELNDRLITITFSEELDENTVTEETVKVWLYPADGMYDDTDRPKQLLVLLTVVDNVLTIEV